MTSDNKTLPAWSQYSVDWDQVQSIEDVKCLMQDMDWVFTMTPEMFDQHPHKHLYKLRQPTIHHTRPYLEQTQKTLK